MDSWDRQLNIMLHHLLLLRIIKSRLQLVDFGVSGVKPLGSVSRELPIMSFLDISHCTAEIMLEWKMTPNG
jgi:hypothetical protein